MDDIAKKIQALLFYEATSMKKDKIKSILNIDENQLINSISNLKESINGQAIVLVETDQELSLRINKELSKFISKYDKRQNESPIGPSAIEVLSIIIYLGKASKSDIDYIRGVNSSASIKTLVLKGYIQKQKQGAKTYYIPKPEALAYLGVDSPERMPDYLNIRNNLLELLGKSYEQDK